MKFFIRVDASLAIGSGHVMRCLTLAEALREKGHSVKFICRDYPGQLVDFLQQKSFQVYLLPFSAKEAYTAMEANDDYTKWLWLPQSVDSIDTISILRQEDAVDWLIVDHYGLSESWEQELRPYVKKIMVIDDLANRRHDCDLLLDQNYYLDIKYRYDHLVSRKVVKLLGPKYALIRPEFLEVRKARKKLGKCVVHPIRNIVIYFGGVDAQNVTAQVMNLMLDLFQVDQYEVDVIVGLLNPHKEQLKQLCQQYKMFHFHCQPDYYHELLMRADLAIAAGGSSSYERFLILLPSIVFSIADNQIQLARDLGVYGAHYYLQSLSISSLLEAVNVMMEHRGEYMDRMSSLIDGQGLARVCMFFDGEQMILRHVTLQDEALIFKWRDSEAVRRYSLDNQKIIFAEHQAWFRRSLNNPKRIILIGEKCDQAIGVFRLDLDNEYADVSIYLNPEYIGQGWGRKLLEAGIEWTRQNFESVNILRAIVLPDNIASVNLFKAYGFINYGTHYEKKIALALM